MLTGVADFDPEDEQPEAGSEDDSADDAPRHDAREHYEKVGKSTLRKPSLPLLGPRYSGSRVSRNTAVEDEGHDPFATRDDDDDDEADDGVPLDLGSDDGEDVSDGASEEEAEEAEGFEDEDASMTEDDDSNEEEEEDDSNGGEDDDSNDEDDDTSMSSDKPSKESRAELAGLLNNSSKSIAATIAAANAADAAKGTAVKKQRQAFDSLLNLRIRLQHALIASNSMSAVTASTAIEDDKAYEAAEAAALNLFNSLSSLRDSLPTQKPGEKRKRAAFDRDASTSSIWKHVQAQDQAASSHQRAVLQKWSQKTQTTTAEAVSSANRLNPSAQTTLLDVLDQQTASTNLPRLVAKTRLARSCAPVQQSKPRRTPAVADESNGAADPHDEDEDRIYDDADFYGVLLKELLEARNANAAVDYSIAASNAANGKVESEYQAARQAKTHSRPDVDRKASKGRKMKYTVHEKLQNFMAPEDRGRWERRQRDELFGSLFGRRSALQEDGEEEDDAQMGEDEALMLFQR